MVFPSSKSPAKRIAQEKKPLPPIIPIPAGISFDEWTEIFDSKRLRGALLDRLTHRRHNLEVNGKSYRLRQASKRSTCPHKAGLKIEMHSRIGQTP